MVRRRRFLFSITHTHSHTHTHTHAHTHPHHLVRFHFLSSWSCYLFLGQTFYFNFCFSVFRRTRTTSKCHFVLALKCFVMCAQSNKLILSVFHFCAHSLKTMKTTATATISFSTTQTGPSEHCTAQEKAVHFNSLLYISFSIFFPLLLLWLFCAFRFSSFFLFLLLLSCAGVLSCTGRRSWK